MNYSLAKTYVLRVGSMNSNYINFYEDLKKTGYDFQNETLTKDIKTLKKEEILDFLEQIQDFISNLKMEDDKKLFLLFLVIFSNLSNIIDVKNPLISPEICKIARKIYSEHSQPDFMEDLIKRHSNIHIQVREIM